MLENLEITRQSDESVCGLVVWLRFFRTVSCPCWDTCWGFRSFIIEIKQLKLRFLDWIHADIGWHWMTRFPRLRDSRFRQATRPCRQNLLNFTQAGVLRKASLKAAAGFILWLLKAVAKGHVDGHGKLKFRKLPVQSWKSVHISIL